MLKALAFQGRGENKDAYDLVYMLQNYGGGIDDVFQRLQPLLKSPFAQQALAVLERDFTEVDHVGTKRVAEFLGDPQDETTEPMLRAPCGPFSDFAKRTRSIVPCRHVPLSELTNLSTAFFLFTKAPRESPASLRIHSAVAQSPMKPTASPKPMCQPIHWLGMRSLANHRPGPRVHPQGPRCPFWESRP